MVSFALLFEAASLFGAALAVPAIPAGRLTASTTNIDQVSNGTAAALTPRFDESGVYIELLAYYCTDAHVVVTPAFNMLYGVDNVMLDPPDGSSERAYRTWGSYTISRDLDATCESLTFFAPNENGQCGDVVDFFRSHLATTAGCWDLIDTGGSPQCVKIERVC